MMSADVSTPMQHTGSFQRSAKKRLAPYSRKRSSAAVKEAHNFGLTKRQRAASLQTPAGLLARTETAAVISTPVKSRTEYGTTALQLSTTADCQTPRRCLEKDPVTLNASFLMKENDSREAVEKTPFRRLVNRNPERERAGLCSSNSSRLLGVLSQHLTSLERECEHPSATRHCNLQLPQHEEEHAAGSFEYDEEWSTPQGCRERPLLFTAKAVTTTTPDFRTATTATTTTAALSSSKQSYHQSSTRVLSFPLTPHTTLSEPRTPPTPLKLGNDSCGFSSSSPESHQRLQLDDALMFPFPSQVTMFSSLDSADDRAQHHPDDHGLSHLAHSPYDTDVKESGTPRPRCRHDVTVALPRTSSTPGAPARHRRGRKTILYGLMAGDAQLVESAILDGEDPNVEISVLNETTGRHERLAPLLAAAKNAQASIVKLLLEHGAVVNSVNQHGQTALHMVCMCVTLAAQSVEDRGDDNDDVTRSSSHTVPSTWLELGKFLDTIDGSGVAHHTTRRTPSFPNLDVPLSSEFKSRSGTASTSRLLKFEQLADNVIATATLLLQHGIEVHRVDAFGKLAVHYAHDAGFDLLVTLVHRASQHQSDHRLSHDDDGGISSVVRRRSSNVQHRAHSFLTPFPVFEFEDAALFDVKDPKYNS